MQHAAHDGELQIALAMWNQPACEPNLTDQKGGAWNVNFTIVSWASLSVPEPKGVLLVALALSLMAATSRHTLSPTAPEAYPPSQA